MRANGLPAAVLVLGSALGAIILMQEIGVDRVARASRQAIAGLSPTSEDAVRQELAGCENARDERVLVSCLAGIAGLVQSSSAPAIKAAELARGRRVAAHFGAEAPASGEALIAIALLESHAEDNGAERRAITALMESYRRTPYLRMAGLWRLWYASHHWDALTPQARRAVISEAIWYGSLGRDDRNGVLSALLDSPVLVRVAIRLPGEPGETLPLPQMPE